MRKILAIGAAVALAGAMAAPAVATTPDDDGLHKVFVCHATNSLKNPYVFIEVDIASAADFDKVMGHHEHVLEENTAEKKGWGDYISAFTYDEETYPAQGALVPFPEAKKVPANCLVDDLK